eukprot:TRINITY_DN779_c0_g1_i2.p1 TRINITY_DN779_c0_g1~~TRINITY_DN779_c0_g1_i2.p1  ORF type:complete len:222 (+),score=48.43 TRINITY_DN779_c0_g1_i2:120-785(+)
MCIRDRYQRRVRGPRQQPRPTVQALVWRLWMARIITPEAWTASPWRNGGGITHEVLREARGDAFAFRLSVADITAGGPFSGFEGVDRVITLLEGDGCRLVRPGGEEEVPLMSPGDPLFAFPGEEEVRGELVGGAVKMLNMMVNRSDAQVSCHRLTWGGTAGAVECEGAPADVVLVFVVSGVLGTAAGGAGRHDCVVGTGAIELELAAVEHFEAIRYDILYH